MAETLTALAAVITAVGVIVIGFLTYRRTSRADTVAAKAADAAVQAQSAAMDAKAAVVETKDGIYQIGKRIDGRMDELLAAAKATAHAAGMLEQRERDAEQSSLSPTTGPAGGA